MILLFFYGQQGAEPIAVQAMAPGSITATNALVGSVTASNARVGGAASTDAHVGAIDTTET